MLPFMLLDLLTLVLILKARNDLAAKQFLGALTVATKPETCPPSMDYQKTILVKGTALVDGGREWVVGLY
jgi:hypothetical protein